MRIYLFGLIGFTLLAGQPLMAQPPQGAPCGVGSVGCLTSAPGAGPSCEHCAKGTEFTCVPEPYLKKTTKVVYKSGSEPLCLPHHRCLFGHSDCDAGQCEPPYTRHYLMKKTLTIETPAIRCTAVP